MTRSQRLSSGLNSIFDHVSYMLDNYETITGDARRDLQEVLYIVGAAQDEAAQLPLSEGGAA